jgi:hypothetical protein
VRLAGGPDDASGRLELLVGGRWGAACTGALDGAAARVVCRQLGFSGGAVRGGAAYGGGGGPRLPAMLAAAACNGTEARLSDCRLRLSGHGAPSCPPKDAAGLDCSNAGGLPPRPGVLLPGAVPLRLARQAWQSAIRVLLASPPAPRR